MNINETQSKKRNLDHHIREALRFADKADFQNVRLMFSQAEQEMRYLESDIEAASGVYEGE